MLRQNPIQIDGEKMRGLPDTQFLSSLHTTPLADPTAFAQAVIATRPGQAGGPADTAPT